MIKLFCFPYAGGSSFFYYKWKNKLKNINVIPIEYPGRGSKMSEELLGDMDALVTNIYSEYIDDFSGSYAFFGHSLGAQVSFDLLHLIKQNAKQLPQQLFISGRKSPEKSGGDINYLLPDNELLINLQQLGGRVEHLLNDDELRQLYLPVLKADLDISQHCITARTQNPTKLDVPFAILAGKNDEMDSFENMKDWELLTEKCTFHILDGGHFFVEDSEQEVLDIINSYLGA